VIAIVPPAPVTRRAWRRPHTRRWACWSASIGLLAGVVLGLQFAVLPEWGAWLRLGGCILGACAVVGSLIAVKLRLTEEQREVTVRVSHWGTHKPPVIHLNS
jgi:hypothetical protein